MAALPSPWSSALAAPDTSASAFHETRLDNGLTVIVKADNRSPVAVSMVWYRVGSIDEVTGSTGISHVLEHMMFKGTDRIGPGEFAERISRAGGRSNAFTSRDHTAYHQQLHSRDLELAFELEADRMANLRMTEQEFAKEIRVVMEERRQRIADSPQALVYEHLLATAFIAHPYRTPIIGWMNDLERLRLEDVQRWYEAWYVPQNATIVVVGDVEPQAVFALARKHFGPMASRLPPERTVPADPEQLGIKRIEVQAPAELPYLAMAYRVPALRDVNRDWEPYALSILSGVLDGHSAARLQRELVRSARLADSIGTSYDGYARGPGLFYVSGTPAAGRTVEELERGWRSQIERLIQEGVGEDELRRVKAQVVSGYVFQQDSMFSQAAQIGRLHGVGLPYDAADVIVARLQQVTAEQVREVARKYLVDRNLTVAVLDPLPTAATTAGHAGRADR